MIGVITNIWNISYLLFRVSIRVYNNLVENVNYCRICLEILSQDTTQSRIIGAVRGTHSQLWGTTIPVCSPYAPRKDDKRFGTLAIV